MTEKNPDPTAMFSGVPKQKSPKKSGGTRTVGKPVSLEAMLDRREARAADQRRLQAETGMPLISFTLNIPGPYKNAPLVRQCFDEGRRLIERVLRERNIPVQGIVDHAAAPTGPEITYALPAKPRELKSLMIPLEETHPLGRLFDIDVLDRDGRILDGRELRGRERSCLICGGPVWRCARERTHSAADLSRRAFEIMDAYFREQYSCALAAKVVRSLITEVCIAPKPGLVDRLDSGAHRDMDLFTFINSACALFPYFKQLSLSAAGFQGAPKDLLRVVRYQGLLAEDAMYAATGGVNTHRGAIFSLGILCAALSYAWGNDLSDDEDSFFDLCSEIAGSLEAELFAEPAPFAHTDAAGSEPAALSHGRDAFKRYGITGARGEAAAGFPHLRAALPALREYLARGYTEEAAGIAALLHLMAGVEDTNITARSDGTVLRGVQAETDRYLRGGPELSGILSYARKLKELFADRGISPGGSADLLAAALLVRSVFDDRKEPDKKDGIGGTAGRLKEVTIPVE
jgi:holo-ACP synthase/triphosphoribosyl-dephospho-CoA synthase